MEKKEHRRKAKRYPASWKAAVVFDKAHGKPVLHTQTVDLSVGGAAIVTDHGDLSGLVVTVLLAQPGPAGDQPAKMIKVRAQVVSSSASRNPPAYRHGLRFLRAPDDGLDAIEGLLQTHAADAPPAPAPAAPAPGGRLAQLRQLAQAKLTEEKKPDAQEEINRRVDEALRRAFEYLKELCEQLNVVKPAYPKGYAIPGVPEFSGLAWASGRADFRAREVSPGVKQWEQVTLYVRIANGKKLRVTRESPANARLRQLLTDNKIRFEEREVRDEKGYAKGTNFDFEGEVIASVLFEGDYRTGEILLRTRNVERFGLVEHRLVPEAIDEAAMEEFAGFILGETSRVGPLLLRRP